MDTRYVIGEVYWACYTRGWQCPAQLLKFLDNDRVMMYNKRHGFFITTIQDLDAHN